jgi:hypothetical protein
VANRVSSTVLSKLSAPEENACSIAGRASRAPEAAIQRWAFQVEIP